MKLTFRLNRLHHKVKHCSERENIIGRITCNGFKSCEKHQFQSQPRNFHIQRVLDVVGQAKLAYVQTKNIRNSVCVTDKTE